MSQDIYESIWNGRDSLLPDRAERWDSRFRSMPTVDDEEDEVISVKKKRKYNRTGNHKGKFSRTDPSAMHYKPTVKKETNGH